MLSHWVSTYFTQLHFCARVILYTVVLLCMCNSGKSENTWRVESLKWENSVAIWVGSIRHWTYSSNSKRVMVHCHPTLTTYLIWPTSQFNDVNELVQIWFPEHSIDDVILELAVGPVLYKFTYRMDLNQFRTFSVATSSQSTFAHNRVLFAITDLYVSKHSLIWPKNVCYLGIWELWCLSIFRLGDPQHYRHFFHSVEDVFIWNKLQQRLNIIWAYRKVLEVLLMSPEVALSYSPGIYVKSYSSCQSTEW